LLIVELEMDASSLNDPDDDGSFPLRDEEARIEYLHRIKTNYQHKITPFVFSTPASLSSLIAWEPAKTPSNTGNLSPRMHESITGSYTKRRKHP